MKVKASAPASIGNLTVGFDVLGLCLEAPEETVQVELSGNPEIEIFLAKDINPSIPTNPIENTAGRALINIKDKLDYPGGFKLTILKKMPLGSGMGSSGATAVAALLAANRAMEDPMNDYELLEIAIDAESMNSRSKHGDNVAPQLFGGIVLISDYSPLSIVELPIPAFLHYSLILPELHMNTSASRKLLPTSLSLPQVSLQSATMGAFIHSLHTSDKLLMTKSLRDFMAEPQRKALIPGFDQCRFAAMDAGAIHLGISGSGPSLFALSDSLETAEKVANSIKFIFDSHNLKSQVHFGKVNSRGAYIHV